MHSFFALCFMLLKYNIMQQYLNNLKIFYFNIIKKEMFDKVCLPFMSKKILVILTSEKYFEISIFILYQVPEFSRKLTFPASLGFLAIWSLTDKLNCQWNVFIHLYQQYCPCLLCFPLGPYFFISSLEVNQCLLIFKRNCEGKGC